MRRRHLVILALVAMLAGAALPGRTADKKDDVTAIGDVLGRFGDDVIAQS